MANEQKDPKVVPGDDVKFAEGSAQADSLDRRVEERNMAETKPWRVENMTFLAEQIWPVMEESYEFRVTMDQRTVPKEETKLPTPKSAKGVIPYWAFLRRAENMEGLAVFTSQGRMLTPALIRPLFRELYGDALKVSGIYKAIGLDREEPVAVAEVRPYFVEAAPVSALEGKVIKLVGNPYLSLLTYPIEVRPLFTGALRELNPKIDHRVGVTEKDFVNPLTTNDIFAYARKVNELSRVRDYLELLKQKKEK